MRWQLNAHLPQGVRGRQRLPGLLVLKALMFRLALLVGLRHRDVRILPVLLARMPSVDSEIGADIALSHNLAHDTVRLPGSNLGARVEKNAGAVRADRDAVTEPPAHIVLHLMLAQRLQRPPGMGLIVKRDRHSPVVVCHGRDSTLQGAETTWPS